MKKRPLLGIVVLFVAASICLFLYREVYRPKRVWVSYSEKAEYVGYKELDERKLWAEEGFTLQISGNKGCMVLTRDRQKADYIVSSSVIRYSEDAPAIGSAELSITKQNGDVVFVGHFIQDRKLNPNDEILEQVVSWTWHLLCQKQQ
jgi:hypothetical protein